MGRRQRSYNNLALIHQNHCQHGWERFLPWHRVYLYEFEQALQDFCPDVTMPWWDFPASRYKPEDPRNGAILPDAFKGFLTEDSTRFLRDHGFPAKIDTLVGQLWANPTEIYDAVSKACGKEYVAGENRKRLIDALLEANSLWYPLRYSGQFGDGTINTKIHYHYPTQDDLDEILGLRTFRDFGGGSLYVDSFGFLDQNPHNTMHIWTGGMNPAFKADAPADRNKAVRVAGRRFHQRDDLYSEPQFGDMFSNLTASYDAIFWPIHVNVDRTWWEWQTQHPTGLPTDLDAVLSPWSYTVRDMLEISRFGYEYVRCSYFMPVGMEAPIAKFVSKPIPIDSKVKKFRKAEVRLHWVPQLLRSCFVRAFVNQPGADATTPVRNNPHYAGYLAIFGHGECYGGPGHCDLPPPRARAYDQRPRSHNTPRNHRIDITQAARAALEKSDALTLTLVVIGVDYRAETDLLRLEGVSVNFLD